MKLRILLWLVCSPLMVWAQYGHEWINFSQQYYKIPVAKDGVYRLTYNDLVAAGLPVATLDPRRIQLYHRGNEQAIVFNGQADSKLDPGDYFEFRGLRNDGTLDASLYKPASSQPHPYYNLYSDTTAYFLTWSAVQPGKRVTDFFEINASALPKETYRQTELLQVFTAEYAGGYQLREFTQSYFDAGEGWTDTPFCVSGCSGATRDYTVSGITGTVPASGLPTLEMLVVGRYPYAHRTEIYVGPNTSSLRLLTTLDFLAYDSRKVSMDLAWSDVSGSGSLVVRLKALGADGLNDFQSVSYLKLTFPQQFDLGGAAESVVSLAPNAGGTSYVEFVNAPAGARVWDVSDPDNVVNIGTVVNGALLTAIVPNTATPRKLLVSNVVSTPTIKPVTFRNINPPAHNYLIITHPVLMKPALGYTNPVKEYAGYRHSVAGGGFDTLVVTMDQLHNQFNYGESSSRSIYQFVRYMVELGAPKYLLLVGKGLEIHVNEGAVQLRKTGSLPSGARDLVPTAGLPGSDMAFSAGLTGTTVEPAIATGRISAASAAEVAAYYNKVVQAEQSPFDALWHKNLLHLSGGIAAGEPALFRSYVDGFASTATGPFLGGKVATRAKSDPSTVQFVNVSDEVNKGISLITFFGHSSPGTIDIDIGYASDPTLGYNNPGRYPAFLINGCNAGNFFRPGQAFGEDWMTVANKGAKNFIAHSSFGDEQLLKRYTDRFYQVAFADSSFMSRGIGDVQREVGRQFIAAEGTSISTTTQVQQMVLLGDPALSLFGARLPDLETNDNAIFIAGTDGKPVTALSTEFLVKVIVRNFGRATHDSVRVRISRSLFDNTVVNYDSVFRPVFYQDTLVFKLPRVATNGFGNNTFTVTLDYPNKIKELNESNNSGQVSQFFARNGTRNLYPSPYSIVHTSTIELLWQSSDLLSDSRQFLLEVDTVASFDSPFLQQVTATGKVLVRHQLNLPAGDSLAFYWRTRLAQPGAGESANWETSSFTSVVSGPEGWTQGHRDQFSEDILSGLVHDPATGKLSFQQTQSTVTIHNYGSANATDFTQTSFKVNAIEYNLGTQGQPCRDNTLNLVAFDRRSTSPYAGIPFNFQDPRTCGREPQLINSFLASEVSTGNGDDVAQLVDNVHTSDSVVLFSIGDPSISSWPAALLTKLNEVGVSAAQFTALAAGEPFVIFGKKGAAPGTAKVYRPTQAPANAQELLVSRTVTGLSGSGTITSTLIGPASSWQSLQFHVTGLDVNDHYSVDIAGVGLDGKQTTLQTGVHSRADLSNIAAAQYPLLKLTYRVSDDLTLTPAQLRRWLVGFVPAAEGILFFKGNASTVTLQEGQTWSGTYGFKNISAQTFPDSLRVNVQMFNTTARKAYNKTFRIKAPAPADTTTFTVTEESKGRAGLNDVGVIVNPRILPEQYYDNNQIDLAGYLDVQRYANHPVVDVLFDGRYILDGEIVSPDPNIAIRLKDGNQFLFKTDTTNMSMFLTLPGATLATPVYFKRTDVHWYPATAKTDFRIEFTPKGLKDGVYTLQVKLADASGNSTGAQPYTVRFEVVNESAVSNFYPYPNPFSTHTRFVFTLTGSQVPDQIKVQIMTVSGKVVREITQDELGPLHIGNNLSAYAWDGKDEFGDQLANGVYLYRVIVKSNGSALGHRATAGDKGFEKGYGKLYLLR